MSNLSHNLNADSINPERMEAHLAQPEQLILEVEQLKARILHSNETLQSIRGIENLEEIFIAVTTKLLNLFQAVHVAIFKLDRQCLSELGNRMQGTVIARAIAPNCDRCTQINIEADLNEVYQWGEGNSGTILDLFTSGLTQCQAQLAQIFAGKSFILIPIILPEMNREQPLWGFLTVHQCTGNCQSFVTSWSQVDIALLQQAATQLGIALSHEHQKVILVEQLEESKKAYDILFRLTEHYRTLIEQIPSVSYVSPVSNSAEFAYVSPQLKSLLGVPTAEWEAGFFNSWEKYVHPDDRELVQQQVRKTIATGEPFVCEYRMIRQDGKIIWVRDNAYLGLAFDQKTPVLRGSAFDISEQKESELKFKGIFNNTFQFTGLLSNEGILLEANQTALDFGGLKSEEVIGKFVWETYWFSISALVQSRVKESVKEAASGKFIRYELDVFGAGQKIVTIDFSIRPLRDESGQVVLLIPEGRDISEMKAIEKALRKSESRLEEAQKVAKIGSWEWSIANNEIRWSKEMFNVFGRDYAMGTPNYEEHLLDFTPNSRQKLSESVQQTIATGASYCIELELQNPNSQELNRYVEAIGHAKYGDNHTVSRLYGTVQDVSDRVAAAEKLSRNKAILRLTIENAPVGIATLSLDGKFLNVNQSFCKIYGYSANELLEMTALDITHPNSIAKTLAALQHLMNQEVVNLELEKQYIHKDGHVIDAISRVSLIKDSNNEPLQIITSVEDVTERKQTEAKLTAAKLAEAENRAKSEFIAVMSHELRTPMNAVIGMTDILLNTPLSPQQQQYVSTIRQGGDILLSVINNILDFSRIESGHFELEEHAFSPQKCVEEVIELMTSRVTEKSIELVALVAQNIPTQFLSDYNRLRQILVNLVSNAIKFTENGEIVIKVDSRLVDQSSNIHELIFQICDTGIGIAPEAIGKVFQAFSQADRSINRKYGGTGLGLAICKQLCELMGGAIAVESTVGQGSTFTFSIQAKEIETVKPAINPEFIGKKILSISSSKTIQEAVSSYSQAWGIDIKNAYSATEALQMLHLHDFNAIIIDSNLSDIEGIELAQDLQNVDPDLKFIFLSKINMNTDVQLVKFANSIPKPISPAKLYQAYTNTFLEKLPHITSSPVLQLSNLDTNLAEQYPLQILVVEDNLVNQQILMIMLERLGYRSGAVNNGLEALKAIEKLRYDLIFMDIQMPIMDGLTASQSIRQLPDYSPWIIGLSANAFSESRELALATGMNEYLTKPLLMENLVEVLQKTIQIFNQHKVNQSVNIQTLSNLKNSVGEQNLSKLISIYLNHTQEAIAKMQESIKQIDLATIDHESHALRGGSGTFGARKLFLLCQDLQHLCRSCIQTHNYSPSNIEKIETLIQHIELEATQVSETLRSLSYDQI